MKSKIYLCKLVVCGLAPPARARPRGGFRLPALLACSPRPARAGSARPLRGHCLRPAGGASPCAVVRVCSPAALSPLLVPPCPALPCAAASLRFAGWLSSALGSRCAAPCGRASRRLGVGSVGAPGSGFPCGRSPCLLGGRLARPFPLAAAGRRLGR